MNEKIIKLENVSFSYGNNNVLKDVDLAINSGDFMAIVGPNGSAKSTLLKLIIGELKPQKGKVWVLGQELLYFRDWDKIAYLSQQGGNINTSFPATVEEVVSSGYYSGLGRLFDNKDRKKAVEKALKTVGMGEFAKRLIGKLSGGQRQKVFLAKCLVKQPSILLLDEPTTGIDAKFQEEFYKLLTKLNTKQNMTIIMVTHDLDEAVNRAKTIAYMKNRKVFVNNKMSKRDLTKALGFV